VSGADYASPASFWEHYNIAVLTYLLTYCVIVEGLEVVVHFVKYYDDSCLQNTVSHLACVFRHAAEAVN